MRLRRRLADLVTTRIRQFAPELLLAAWGEVGQVVVGFEQVRVNDQGGTDRAFELAVKLTGRIRVDLRCPSVDTAATEDLIESLVATPLHLPPAQVAPGALTERARTVLDEMRLAERDEHIVLSFFLNFDADILRAIGGGVVPHNLILPPPFEGVGA